MFSILQKHLHAPCEDNAEIDDMIHFAQADVLICSKSGFSNIASVLNAKCVLHPTGRVDAGSTYRNAPYHYHYNAEDGLLANVNVAYTVDIWNLEVHSYIHAKSFTVFVQSLCQFFWSTNSRKSRTVSCDEL